MTREEALKRLKEARSTIQPFRYVDEAIDYAIKALEQEPIYYPPCQDCHTKMNEIVRAYDNVKSLDDAVSRQEVMELLNKRYCHKEPYEWKEGNATYKSYETYYMINFDKLKALPSVLPKRNITRNAVRK